ncbi:MAG: hypothetical protein ABGX12_02200 [Desulfurobacteriaceae bacterium]
MKKFSVIPDIEKIRTENFLPKEERLKKVAGEILISLKEKKDFIKILLSEVSLYEREVAEIYRRFLEKLDRLIAEVLSTDEQTARLFHSSLFGYFLSEEIFLGKEVEEKEAKKIVDKLVKIFAEYSNEKNF